MVDAWYNESFFQISSVTPFSRGAEDIEDLTVAPIISMNQKRFLMTVITASYE